MPRMGFFSYALGFRVDERMTRITRKNAFFSFFFSALLLGRSWKRESSLLPLFLSLSPTSTRLFLAEALWAFRFLVFDFLHLLKASERGMKVWEVSLNQAVGKLFTRW